MTYAIETLERQALALADYIAGDEKRIADKEQSIEEAKRRIAKRTAELAEVAEAIERLR